MKRLGLIITCLFVNFTLFAQEGVCFRDLSYHQALEVAKAEKKLLFVDCYTSWCGPCQQMAKEVFTQKEAGDYFNSRFVCVKYDMEKGEGKKLDKQWDIQAYPTFMIIRPDGEIQHIIVGGGVLDRFIEQVERGLNKKSSFGYLNKRYEQGKITKKEMLSYVRALREAYKTEKADEVKKELMRKLSDKEKVKVEYWPLFMECAVGSEEYEYILKHLEKFQKSIGKEKIDQFLKEAYNATLQK